MGLASECNFPMVSIGQQSAKTYIPHKQDRKTRLIFIAGETKVCLQTLQTRCSIVVSTIRSVLIFQRKREF